MFANSNRSVSFWALFCAAFAVRVALVLATHQYRDLERFELERVALSLASGHGFANPYAFPTGPTAHVTPAYPLLLSLIFRWFGTGTAAELVKQIWACAVTALQCALLPIAARALGFPTLVGVAAGAFCALLPVKFSTETMGDWEAPYTALALMLLAVVTTRTWERKDFSIRSALIGGACWGVGLLVASVLLPLYVAVLGAGLFLTRGRNLQFFAAQTAIAGLFLLPWAMRNEIALGSPILTRSNTGIEIRVSNNDQAGPLEGVNFRNGVYHLYHPLQSAEQAARVKQMGEVAYNREALAAAVNWMRAHPQRFMTLTVERIWNFWFPGDPGNKVKGLLLWATAALGLLGLVAWARTRHPSALVLGLMVLVVPLPNYLVHVGLRHKYPLDWICVLCAAYFVITVWQRYSGRDGVLQRELVRP